MQEEYKPTLEQIKEAKEYRQFQIKEAEEKKNDTKHLDKMILCLKDNIKQLEKMVEKGEYK